MRRRVHRVLGAIAFAGAAAAQSTRARTAADRQGVRRGALEPTRRCPTAPLPCSSARRSKFWPSAHLRRRCWAWAAAAAPPLLEQILERTIKGLDVEIINRGFSGELADAAGERIKIEVALNHPDIVLWQVGTNDAFAHVPVESFQLSVSNTVRWLKAHNVDVILVGLHYIKKLAKDEHYQAIRASLRRVASAENVLRIGRYEAMEVLSRTTQANGQPEQQDFGLSETGFNCMAQYIARTITVGLFARPPRQTPQGLPPSEPNNQPVPGGQPSDQQK